MNDIQNIVIRTGAGVSAESGIDTFATAADCGNSIASRCRDAEAFARDPDLVAIL